MEWNLEFDRLKSCDHFVGLDTLLGWGWIPILCRSNLVQFLVPWPYCPYHETHGNHVGWSTSLALPGALLRTNCTNCILASCSIFLRPDTPRAFHQLWLIGSTHPLKLPIGYASDADTDSRSLSVVRMEWNGMELLSISRWNQLYAELEVEMELGVEWNGTWSLTD